MVESVNVNTAGVLGAGGGSLQSTVSAFTDMTTIYKREVEPILMEAAEIIFKAALENIAIDTGALFESGRIVIEQTGKGKRAEILFGGEEFPVTPTRNTRGGVNGDGVVDYAFFVHEGISPTGRGAGSSTKFLERAALSTRSEVAKLFAVRLKAATKVKVKRKR